MSFKCHSNVIQMSFKFKCYNREKGANILSPDKNNLSIVSSSGTSKEPRFVYCLLSTVYCLLSTILLPTTLSLPSVEKLLLCRIITRIPTHIVAQMTGAF